LKAGAELIADGFSEATVLFADIVDFTKLAASMPAESVVELLNELFSRFDLAAAQRHIEKIKTIGDAYMAVCGLPEPSSSHIEQTVELAMEMMKIARGLTNEKGVTLRLRIGINTGPVVAGIIGRHKFIYDLWGDTVNLASRMESLGVPDHIQVTSAVFEKVCGRYPFQKRGAIEVKGKGTMETYILDCSKPT
jgi:class 3 adenylate cyclase